MNARDNCAAAFPLQCNQVLLEYILACEGR